MYAIIFKKRLETYNFLKKCKTNERNKYIFQNTNTFINFLEKTIYKLKTLAKRNY